jgi:hypothetical protein
MWQTALALVCFVIAGVCILWAAFMFVGMSITMQEQHGHAKDVAFMDFMATIVPTTIAAIMSIVAGVVLWNR